MNDKDSLGFYKILGVSPNATSAEVKAAYRSKAMELHPDRNSNRDTTADFQGLQAAYDVLSNENLRQQYDAESAIPNTEMYGSYGGDEKIDPICCSKCSAVTAQPRYKVFYSVYGYVFGAYKKPHQGIFCSKCEVSEGLKASAITMVAGWWSVPGFFWSAQAVLQNLVGGRFNEQNARLQGYQAMYFSNHGKIELARAVAIGAMRLVDKAASEKKLRNSLKKKFGYEISDPLQPLRDSLTKFISSFPSDLKSSELKVPNDVFNKLFAYQSLLILIFGSVVSSFIYFQEEQSREIERVRLEKEGIESEKAAAIVAQQEAALKKAERPLPVTGIFKITGKRGFNQKNLPPFKITNSPGAHTLLKLVRVSDGVEVMSIFIRAGQAAEVGVPIGDYRAKIASGQTWYGDSIRFGPNTSYATFDAIFSFSIEGSQLLGHEVTLTQVKDGNLNQTPLNASDF